MKLWLVSAGWDHEGANVIAVCTTEELAKKAEAAIKAEAPRGWSSYDYYEIQCAEADSLYVNQWPSGTTTIEAVGDYDKYIPIVEYQNVKAV
jgi:hypothetical protein